MIGFQREAREFTSPMPLEECLRKLQTALSAPSDDSFFARIGGGAPRIRGTVEYGQTPVKLRLSPPIAGRVFAIYLTADLEEENGKTTLHCQFSIRRLLAVCMLAIFIAMPLVAGFIFLVSVSELIGGSPYSIHVRPGRSWLRFAGLPISLAMLVGIALDTPRLVAHDRHLLVSFLWKTIRARPVEPPREIRDGFQI
jgi:hypothetical protein